MPSYCSFIESVLHAKHQFTSVCTNSLIFPRACQLVESITSRIFWIWETNRATTWYGIGSLENIVSIKAIWIYNLDGWMTIKRLKEYVTSWLEMNLRSKRGEIFFLCLSMATSTRKKPSPKWHKLTQFPTRYNTNWHKIFWTLVRQSCFLE
jgi:hypothetical protein